jgi:hypothetical protein
MGAIPVITPVGSAAHASGVALKTLAVSPTAAGDVLVLEVGNPSTTQVTAVSGGGVATWVKVVDINSLTPVDVSLWFGTITVVGAATITITSAAAGVITFHCQQFTAGGPVAWSMDTVTGTTGGMSTSGNYPPVSPSSVGELFIGAAFVANAAGGWGGSTTGFTYDSYAALQFVYGDNAPAPSAPAFTSTYGASGWVAASAFLSAASPSLTNPVGAFASANGTALKTLSVSPTAIGDVLVLAVGCYSSAVQVSAVSGGGVTTWTRLIYAAPGSSEGDSELWWGVITAVGTATITITTAAAYTIFLACQQFTAGGPAVWSSDGAGAASVSTAEVISGTLPPVTPATIGPELYLGALLGLATGGDGSNPGVTFTEGVTDPYIVSSAPYPLGLTLAYDPTAGGPASIGPNWVAGVAWYYSACSALLVAHRPFVAPLAPTNVTPSASAHIDVTVPQIFTATYNAADSWPMSAYALRIKISGGAYAYWNATTQALQPTPAWNPLTVPLGGTFSVTLPAYTLRNGLSYAFSFAAQESGANVDGPFASDVAFTAQAAPVVTVTAPGPVAVGTATPTVSWTEVLAPGTSQTGYEIVVESGSYATGPGAAPGSGTQVYNSGVVSSAALSAATGTLPQPGLYCAFVQVTETGSEVSAWGSSVFVCEASAPPTPTWVSATAGNDPTTGTPRVTLVISTADTGFAGQCYLAVLRSDGAYVRGAGWPTGVCQAIPSGGGSLTLYDYETVPGTSYTYTAQLLAWPPLVSLWSASSGSVTTTTNNAWFILDPTNPATAAQFFPGTLTFVDHEAATTFEPLGTRGTLIKSGAGMKGRQGSLAAGVVTQGAYQQLRAVLLNTGTLLLQGPLEQQYVTVFGDRSGVLTPTTAAAPQGNYWDVITFVTVEQTRP